MCVWKDENKYEEIGVGPIFKKSLVNQIGKQTI